MAGCLKTGEQQNLKIGNVGQLEIWWGWLLIYSLSYIITIQYMSYSTVHYCVYSAIRRESVIQKSYTLISFVNCKTFVFGGFLILAILSIKAKNAKI